jgi:hypothetical protein
MNKFKNILLGLSVVATIGGMSSCTDYLDKEPDSDVSENMAFRNFKNFQGFIEEIYNNIPHKEVHYWETTFNWGEDEITNSNMYHCLTNTMDNGNFRAWFGDGGCWGGSYLYKSGENHTSKDRFQHHIWQNAFYCIRKANVGLQNLDLLVDANQDEIDAIKGELLFFRAWWHEELMIYLGGIPYIDAVLSADDKLTIARPTFQECAKRAAEDFGEAAKYLPADWDKSGAGVASIGKNNIRITKATALAYQGKMLLWAASPLSENGPSLGGGKTYTYNTELAKEAAEALGSAISLIESGQTPYALANYNYESEKDLFDHNQPTSDNNYDDIFYTTSQGFKQPGAKEAMMRGTTFEQANSARWGFATTWGPQHNSLCNGSQIAMPTANYIDYAYGMKNGLPIDDPDSGWDPEYPFKDRDPRFYHDIVFDGEQYIVNNNAPECQRKEEKDGSITEGKFYGYDYTTLYTGGAMRKSEEGSMTGFFEQKLVPHQCNAVDKWADDWNTGFAVYLPYMRVADVYLMYAEAGSAATGCAASSYSSTSCNLTALDAINKIRARVGVDEVSGKYLSGTDFMDCVRRERACELAFEGFRFNDLQRWLLLTEAPYTIKTSAEFTRTENDDWYKKNNPSEAKVKGYRTDNILKERHYIEKHYWFPFRNDEVYIYPDFYQNPGW